MDVLLLLEGTFPYVAGGVSSWVNQMIRGFPELRFGAIFIGSRPQDYGDMRYALPDNLVHLEVTYLNDDLDGSDIRPTKVKADKAVMGEVVRSLDDSSVRPFSNTRSKSGFNTSVCGASGKKSSTRSGRP